MLIIIMIQCWPAMVMNDNDDKFSDGNDHGDDFGHQFGENVKSDVRRYSW